MRDKPAKSRQGRKKLTLGVIPKLLKNTVSEWSEDGAPRLGAALAYYTVFSIAPLMIIGILIAGLFFDNAQSQIMGEVKGLLGDEGGKTIESMVSAAQKPMQSTVATVLAVATLFFGAAGVFVQLKDAMNIIWDVPVSAAGGVMGFIKKYFLSFSMVLGIGFLLLVSLLLSAAVTFIGQMMQHYFPGAEFIIPTLGFVVSFGIITVLFAMLFKFLPDVKIPWRDVWVGAVITACLFVLGKLGLGIYLGKAGAASAYGAAGSLVLVLLWVYYSAQILFFGAEFTQVYSSYLGSRSVTDEPKHASPKDRLIRQIEQERKDFTTAVKTLGFIQPPRNKTRFSRNK